MILDVWQECNGRSQIQKIECIAWRIIESQNRTSTRKLVDNLKEQQILEEIIETAKPPIPDHFRDYHYLLFTPFRYPPLDHGSRFGTTNEPSLWYGADTIETALAEIAFYRFHLLRASEGEYSEVPIKYSAYQVEIDTQRGINLTHLPFINHELQISNPNCYKVSQLLGRNMRQADVEAFYYKSARCPQQGRNIALFAPNGFKHKNPIEPFQTWQGTVTDNKTKMEFIRTNGLNLEYKQFAIEFFMINGILPTLLDNT